MFKLFSKSNLVYDAHELETERNGWSRARKEIGKLVERILIRQADGVIVVSESIAKWYRDNYSLKNVYVIYNFTYKHVEQGAYHAKVFRKRLKLRDDEILFIYQGALGRGRGIEILLNVFSKVDKIKHIVFMGYGDLEKAVKNWESKYSNIHFQPAVKPEEVLLYTSAADVGICLVENLCLSYYCTMPNKVFEYVSSGLPLIVSDFPEMAKIVDHNECGWKVSLDEGSVTDLINKISKEEIEQKRSNVLKCRDDFLWEKQEKKLLTIYRTLGSCAK